MEDRDPGYAGTMKHFQFDFAETDRIPFLQPPVGAQTHLNSGNPNMRLCSAMPWIRTGPRAAGLHQHPVFLGQCGNASAWSMWPWVTRIRARRALLGEGALDAFDIAPIDDRRQPRLLAPEHRAVLLEMDHR